MRARSDEAGGGGLLGCDVLSELLRGNRIRRGGFRALSEPGEGDLRFTHQSEIGRELLALALRPTKQVGAVKSLAGRVEKIRERLRPALLGEHGPDLVRA